MSAPAIQSNQPQHNDISQDSRKCSIAKTLEGTSSGSCCALLGLSKSEVMSSSNNPEDQFGISSSFKDTDEVTTSTTVTRDDDCCPSLSSHSAAGQRTSTPTRNSNSASSCVEKSRLRLNVTCNSTEVSPSSLRAQRPPHIRNLSLEYAVMSASLRSMLDIPSQSPSSTATRSSSGGVVHDLWHASEETNSVGTNGEQRFFPPPASHLVDVCCSEASTTGDTILSILPDELHHLWLVATPSSVPVKIEAKLNPASTGRNPTDHDENETSLIRFQENNKKPDGAQMQFLSPDEEFLSATSVAAFPLLISLPTFATYPFVGNLECATDRSALGEVSQILSKKSLGSCIF